MSALPRMAGVVLLLTSLITAALATEPPTATLSLSTNVIHIGEPVTAQLDIRHPAGASVQLPDITRDRKIVVRDQKVQAAAPGRTNTLASIQITSFIPGSHVVLTNAVLVASGGSVQTAAVPEVVLRVESLLIDTNTPLAGLKPLAAWPVNWPLQALWIVPLTLLIGGLIAWLILRLTARRRGPPALPPREPPHDRALRELAGLLASGHVERGEVEPFYVALSGIVRAYIEERFALRAPEQTTEEFIRTASASTLLTTEQRGLTASFLEQCDLVKFARHRPGPDDMRNAHAAAVRFVSETAPQPAPAAVGGGAA